MTVRKLAVIAVLLGGALTSTYGVYASHLGYPSTHIYYGRAYFYTLNLFALIDGLKGWQLKEGVRLNAAVKLIQTESECLNPEKKLITPGKGPTGEVVLTSDDVGSDDLDKKADRTKKNVFTTTASGELIVDPTLRLSDPGICKDAPGASQWGQVYWKDRDCIKGQPSGNTCYKDLAAYVDGVLTWVTGDNTGQAVGNTDGFVFVVLPTQFAMQAWVTTAGVPDVDSYFSWICQFKANNEIGAAQPGEPYSLSNPPVNGWGGIPPAEYDCTEISNAQFNGL